MISTCVFTLIHYRNLCWGRELSSGPPMLYVPSTFFTLVLLVSGESLAMEVVHSRVSLYLYYYKLVHH